MALALIDGDLVIYRVASALEEATDWGDGVWSLHADLTSAKSELSRQFEKIQKGAGCDSYRPAVSGSGNFRYDLFPDYKANRKGTRRPMLLKALVEHTLEAHDGFRKDGLEADDVLGIWATRDPSADVVICSSDKDLLTIPGKHFVPTNHKAGVFDVSEREAHTHHMRQTLMGDSVDNIPGCPGYGPVKAAKEVPADFSLLEQWERVLDVFLKKGKTPDDALMNARLTRILHASDYDFSSGRVIYWEPPEE